MKKDDWVYWGKELCKVIQLTIDDHVIIEGASIIATIHRSNLILEDDAVRLAYAKGLLGEGLYDQAIA